MWPDGEGVVVFSCPVVRRMRPFVMEEEGRVKRVRGVAYPSLSSHSLYSYKNCLCDCLRDNFCAYPSCVSVLVKSLDCLYSSYCLRVNPGMANRMVDAARAVLNNYLPDVYINTDCVKGSRAGKYVKHMT